DQLPKDIRLLAKRHGLNVRTPSFLKDIAPLEQQLERLIEQGVAPPSPRPLADISPPRRTQPFLKDIAPQLERLIDSTVHPEKPAPRPVEQVVAPPSPRPLAESPPTDELLRLLILGSWYDGGEYEYLIFDRPTNGGKQTNLGVCQKRLSEPDR